MSCNIIRLRGGCYEDDAPENVLFIDDLPGLSLSSLASITPPDLSSAVALIEQKTDVARRRLDSLLRSSLRRRGVRVDTTGEVLPYCNFLNTAAAPGVESVRVNWSYVRSKLARLYIERIKIKAINTAPTTIEIKSEGGDLLWSIDTAGVAGEISTISVNQYFDNRRVFISSSNAALNLYGASCGGVAPCCGEITAPAPPLVVTGWTGDGTTTAAPGIMVYASIKCDPAGLVCCFIPQLREALLYATGAEVAKEIAAPSCRFNFYADLSKDWAAEMSAMWSAEAETLLFNESEGIAELLHNDYCFNCTGAGFSAVPILPG